MFAQKVNSLISLRVLIMNLVVSVDETEAATALEVVFVVWAVNDSLFERVFETDNASETQIAD